MAWISVWQEVDGPKLRKLSKTMETSKAEALGILNFLWFWGMNNADETGRVLEADRWDIEDAIRPTLRIDSDKSASLDAEKVVDALFSAGWLDDKDGCIFIHDWDAWQEQWYKLQKERRQNAERMRRKRSEEKERARQQLEAQPEIEEPAAISDPPAGTDDLPEQKVKSKKPKQPEKKKYAEFVSMTEEEYGKLVEKFGMIFTTACIEELDNYKGAKSKRYASDYRAILSWVADRVQDKRPGLLKMSLSAMDKPQDSSNPFEEWSDQNG